MISYLCFNYAKCYVHIPKEKLAVGSNLDAQVVEGHLVRYTETTQMFRMYIHSQHKADAYRQVKFEPSSYTSVDIHTPKTTCNNADQQILPHDHSRPASSSDQLQSEVIQQQQQTTSQSSSEFLTRYPETLVKASSSARPPPPSRHTFATPESPSRDFLDYSWDSDSKSERGPDDSLPGPSTTPNQSTSSRTPAAPKLSWTKEFDTVPETPKLSFKQLPKQAPKPINRYSEHGFAQLVAEPQSHKEAMASLDSDAWEHAIMEEHQAIMDAGIWEEVELKDLPIGRKLVGSHWVFKVKRNVDRSVERFKARIVTKGYSQVEGLNYDETFVPVTRYNSLHLIIALALHLRLDMSQTDIKSAFLNGDLNEEVCMMHLLSIGLDGKGLRLLISLYRLKQAPLAWFERLSTVLA